jgi:HlyD family secretion protein
LRGIDIRAALDCYIPALDKKAEFEVSYMAAEASFATWSATRARGGFDIRTFEVHARAKDRNIAILPGMSIVINNIK